MILLFTGDVMLDRGVRIQINKYGPDTLFDNVKDIFHSADFTVINLECPVTADTDPQKKRYIFKGDPTWLASMRSAGITHACLANNHTVDQGSKGLMETADNLKKNNIVPLGYGLTPSSACQPVLIDSNGVKIALFAIDLVSLEGWLPNDSAASPCTKSVNEMAENIRGFKLKNKNTWVIVITHWGDEYRTEPNIFQIKTAHLLIDSGADMVIGGHPHVTEGMEKYKDRYIFYSLGNFIFDQNMPGTNQGEVVKVELSPTVIQSVTALSVRITNCIPSIK